MILFKRYEFLYWAARRQYTAAYAMRWNLGHSQAMHDAGYCLDRPDPLQSGM